MRRGVCGPDEHRHQPGLWGVEGGGGEERDGEGWDIGQVGGYQVRYDIIRRVQASFFNGDRGCH